MSWLDSGLLGLLAELAETLDELLTVHLRQEHAWREEVQGSLAGKRGFEQLSEVGSAHWVQEGS